LPPLSGCNFFDNSLYCFFIFDSVYGALKYIRTNVRNKKAPSNSGLSWYQKFLQLRTILFRYLSFWYQYFIPEDLPEHNFGINQLV
jgi:hypothetical protein